MKLYVVRHGESSANATKTAAGWADVPLTAKGKEDARKAGKLICHIDFDKVYSSDILRVIQTQQFALPHAECERTPLIREYNVGTLAGRRFEDLAKDPEIAENRKNRNYVPYGGEDYSMITARVGEFMRMLEQSDYENVLAFSHDGAIKSMIDYAVGVQLPYGSVSIMNGAVSVFEYMDGIWKLCVLNQTKEL